MQAKLHEKYGEKTDRTGFDVLDRKTQRMIRTKLKKNKEWERINGRMWFGYRKKSKTQSQADDKEKQQPITAQETEQLPPTNGKDSQKPSSAVQDPKLPPQPIPPPLDPALLLPAPDAVSRKNWVTKFYEAKKAADIMRQEEVKLMIETNSYPVRTLMERS